MEIKIFGLTVYESKKDPQPVIEETKPTPQAYDGGGVSYSGGFNYASQVFAIPFDGEKDLGEMGNIRRYIIDHVRLRYRSWQLFLESDVCQALFERSATWGIGTGLRLKTAPAMGYLKKHNIAFDTEDFNNQVEDIFKVYANSTDCDYSGKRTLTELASEAWINGDVGGDMLIVLRLIDGIPKVQIIDGANVCTPLGMTANYGIDVMNPSTGNIIRYGIEINKKGEHVAYWVRKNNLSVNVFDFERIEARMTKFPYSQMATMFYGRKYRLDNVRGIPLITAVMETASKMARYREAVLGTAEEQAKIVYQIKHERFSTGENPQVAQMSQASGFFPADLPTDSLGNELANKVAATTNKQTYNNPLGASIEPISHSNGEVNFKDFYTVNFDMVCAVAGYPPEVIMSKYDSNYSASRAAIKDFEHTLTVKRKKFAHQFYQLIYNFCMDVWVLSGEISAPGYVEALANKNQMVLNAYRTATWVGDTVPHIDPYKEIQAIRKMLPEDAANFPLITMEDAIEKMGANGDYYAVLEQYTKERDKGKELGIEMVLPKGAKPEEEDEEGEGKTKKTVKQNEKK